MRVLGISGSLRRDSHNTRLLRAAAALLPPETELELWEGLKEVPPYDADDDRPDEPRTGALRSLADAIDDADVVLFSTPEYNHSIPGQLKNALDWMSRPLADSPLRNRPTAVVGHRHRELAVDHSGADRGQDLARLGLRPDGAEQAGRRADHRGRRVAQRRVGQWP